MVSSLTRLYGFENLELVEDAVQDSFQKALLYLRENEAPDNLQAWLRTTIKNRAIDLFRKAKTKSKYERISGPGFMLMNEVFSAHEIEDNQLRLLFAICHPALKPKDQIIFALKTFSGFTAEEISSALLIDKENTKKTLQRARKKIRDQGIRFAVPSGSVLDERIHSVHLAIYLLFNEGFHSSSKNSLLRQDLVAEAMRLNGLLLERFNDHNSRALMALMCFHAGRIHGKLDARGGLVKLKYQDRSKWNFELIMRGHEHLEKAADAEEYSRFHWEAAIAGEFVNAPDFESTKWEKVGQYYQNLIHLSPSAINFLNLAAILNQGKDSEKALSILQKIDLGSLKGREYLYYSVYAEIYTTLKDYQEALNWHLKALKVVKNESERLLIEDKIDKMRTFV